MRRTYARMIAGIMGLFASAAIAAAPADQPKQRTDAQAVKKHDAYVALAKNGGIDLYFLGDSITDGWQDKASFKQTFGAWHPGNFGVGSDRTENVLWRIQNGELEGVSPKAFVIMIGTNNSGDCTPEQVAAGITAIVKTIQEKNPTAKILLLGIFPRGNGPTDKNRINNDKTNAIIAKLDDGKLVKYLDIGEKFTEKDGTITSKVMYDKPPLHLTDDGYKIWADAILPTLTEWLGPQK